MRRITTLVALVAACSLGISAAQACPKSCTKKASAKLTKSACSAKQACASADKFPTLVQLVGDKKVGCPVEAAKLAKANGDKVIYVVGSERFECRAAAAAAWAKASESYAKRFVTIACVIDGKVIYCDKPCSDASACSSAKVKLSKADGKSCCKASKAKLSKADGKASCSSSAKLAKSAGKTCSATKAKLASADGKSCCKAAKAKLAKADGKDCSKTCPFAAKAKLAKADGKSCKKVCPIEAAKLAKAAGKGCCKAAKAKLAKADGKTCSAAKAKLASADGKTCSKASKAKLAKADGKSCKKVCPIEAAKLAKAAGKGSCKASARRTKIVSTDGKGCCKAAKASLAKADGKGCPAKGKTVKYRVVGRNFDTWAAAVKTRDQATAAVKMVSMKYIVDGKEVNCSSQICPKAKAAGKVVYVVSGEKMQCQYRARAALAMAQCQAAKEACTKVLAKAVIR